MSFIRSFQVNLGAMVFAGKKIATEVRDLISLALPIAAAQAGYALMGLVDTAVVGRLGAQQLGAVGLANALFLAVAIVGLGITMGIDPLISQAIGARNPQRAKAIFWQGVWLSIGLSTVLSLPIAFAHCLLPLFGIEPEIIADTRRFLWYRLPALTTMLLFITARSFLQAMGRVRALLIATIAANLCNFLADIYLVFGGTVLPHWAGPLRSMPPLGVAGAGIATSFSSLAQFLVLIPSIRRAGRGIAPTRRRPRWADLKRSFFLGLPIGLQMGAEVGIFSLVGILAGRLGKEALAAHQISISMASFTFCAALGIGNAGSVRVGWAVGAGDQMGARRSGFVAFATGAGIMALAGLLFWLIPAELAALLTDRPEITASAVPLLAIAAIFQISDGVQAVGAGVLRGAGDTRFAFFANIAGHYGVGLPVALVLGMVLHQGVYGLWWGLCAGLTAVAVSLVVRFWVISSRPIEALEKKPEPHVLLPIPIATPEVAD